MFRIMELVNGVGKIITTQQNADVAIAIARDWHNTHGGVFVWIERTITIFDTTTDTRQQAETEMAVAKAHALGMASAPLPTQLGATISADDGFSALFGGKVE